MRSWGKCGILVDQVLIPGEFDGNDAGDEEWIESPDLASTPSYQSESNISDDCYITPQLCKAVLVSSQSSLAANQSPSDDSSTWVSIDELILTRRDRVILMNPNGWCTDRIIDAGQELIKRDHPDIGGLGTTLNASGKLKHPAMTIPGE